MSEDRHSLLDSARSLIDSVLGVLATRLELIATEVQEEKNRLLSVLALGAAALMSFGFCLLFLSLTITVLLWDENRILVLALLSIFFLLGGGVAVALALRTLKSRPHIFDASIEELKKDRLALDGNADEQG